MSMLFFIVFFSIFYEIILFWTECTFISLSFCLLLLFFFENMCKMNKNKSKRLFCILLIKQKSSFAFFAVFKK